MVRCRLRSSSFLITRLFCITRLLFNSEVFVGGVGLLPVSAFIDHPATSAIRFMVSWWLEVVLRNFSFCYFDEIALSTFIKYIFNIAMHEIRENR